MYVRGCVTRSGSAQPCLDHDSLALASHSRKLSRLCSPLTIFPLSRMPFNTNPLLSNTRTLPMFPANVYPVIRRTPILGIAHEYRINFIAADMIPRPWCDGAR